MQVWATKWSELPSLATALLKYFNSSKLHIRPQKLAQCIKSTTMCLLTWEIANHLQVHHILANKQFYDLFIFGVALRLNNFNFEKESLLLAENHFQRSSPDWDRPKAAYQLSWPSTRVTKTFPTETKTSRPSTDRVDRSVIDSTTKKSHRVQWN